MRLLGAVLAGGQSRRFGSDKAVASLDGRPLIAWASAVIADRVEETVVCGRAEGLRDRPAAGMGPLGGLAAALHYGHAHGYLAVLTMPCDVPALPDQAIDRLLGRVGPAYLDECPVIGVWPCARASDLDAHLAAGHRAMRSWTAAIGARPFALDGPITNINTVADLVRLGDRP